MIATPNFTDLGLPVEPGSERVEDLQYNVVAKTLIVTTRRAPYGALQRRVFVRNLDEERYREIVPPKEQQHFNETVICQGASFAFSRCSDDVDGNYAVIYRIQLPDGNLSPIPLPRVSTDNPRVRVTISRLLNASIDGSEVLVVLAHMPPFVAGSTAPVYCEYRVEKMSTTTGEHDAIAVLRTPYA